MHVLEMKEISSPKVNVQVTLLIVDRMPHILVALASAYSVYFAHSVLCEHYSSPKMLLNCASFPPPLPFLSF